LIAKVKIPTTKRKAKHDVIVASDQDKFKT